MRIDKNVCSVAIFGGAMRQSQNTTALGHCSYLRGHRLIWWHQDLDVSHCVSLRPTRSFFSHSSKWIRGETVRGVAPLGRYVETDRSGEGYKGTWYNFPVEQQYVNICPVDIYYVLPLRSMSWSPFLEIRCRSPGIAAQCMYVHVCHTSVLIIPPRHNAQSLNNDAVLNQSSIMIFSFTFNVFSIIYIKPRYFLRRFFYLWAD